MVTAIVDPKLGWTKEKLVPALRDRNIDCRPFFYPLSMLPAYESVPGAAAARARNAASYAVTPCGVNLPSALSLTREQGELGANTLTTLLHGRDDCPTSTRDL